MNRIQLFIRTNKAGAQRFFESKRTRKVAIPKNSHLRVSPASRGPGRWGCAVRFYGNGETKFRGSFRNLGAMAGQFDSDPCTLYDAPCGVIECRCMDISFNCPCCGQQLSVEERGAGMEVNCPSCNEKIDIPRSTAPQVLKVSLPPAAPPSPKPERVKYEASTDTFRGTLPQVAKHAMRAIQALGWKLDNVNATLGLVTFETGMTLGS